MPGGLTIPVELLVIQNILILILISDYLEYFTLKTEIKHGFRIYAQAYDKVALRRITHVEILTREFQRKEIFTGFRANQKVIRQS